MPHGIYWSILVICWGGLGMFCAAGWFNNLWKAPVVLRRRKLGYSVKPIDSNI